MKDNGWSYCGAIKDTTRCEETSYIMHHDGPAGRSLLEKKKKISPPGTRVNPWHHYTMSWEPCFVDAGDDTCTAYPAYKKKNVAGAPPPGIPTVWENCSMAVGEVCHREPFMASGNVKSGKCINLKLPDVCSKRRGRRPGGKLWSACFWDAEKSLCKLTSRKENCTGFDSGLKAGGGRAVCETAWPIESKQFGCRNVQQRSNCGRRAKVRDGFWHPCFFDESDQACRESTLSSDCRGVAQNGDAAGPKTTTTTDEVGKKQETVAAKNDHDDEGGLSASAVALPALVFVVAALVFFHCKRKLRRSFAAAQLLPEDARSRSRGGRRSGSSRIASHADDEGGGGPTALDDASGGEEEDEGRQLV